MPDTNNPYSPPATGTNSSGPVPLTGGSPYGPMRATGGLGLSVRILLVVQSLVAAAWGVCSFYYAEQATRGRDVFWNAEGTEQSLFNDIYSLIAILLLVLFLITVVVFCVWTNKSMMNAWALRKDASLTLMKPGWAVGFYFVPIALLWKPFEGMRQIWETTFAGEGGKNLTLLRWWWGFWLLNNFADNISQRLGMESLDEYVVSGFFEVAAALLSLVAATLLIIIVGRVTQRQMEYYNGTEAATGPSISAKTDKDSERVE